MVKKMVVWSGYLLFFIMALILFVPKSNLYFFMEKSIKPYGVILSNETLHPELFSLNISHIDVSVQGIDSAVIHEAKITLLGVYNAVELKGIRLADVAKSWIPLYVAEATLHYSVVNPLVIEGFTKGDFGEAKAVFSLKEQHLHVVLKPSKLMIQKYKNSLRKLKKLKSGEYIYDVAL